MSAEYVTSVRVFDPETGELADTYTRSAYRNVQEALLQAAHDEVVTPGRAVEIREKDAVAVTKAQIKAAAKRLRAHRKASNGIEGDDTTPAPTGELEAASNG